MTRRKKSTIWNLSREEIQKKVNNCNSISDMLEAFGYKRSSGSMAKVMKEVIQEYNIDTNCKDVEKFMVHDYFTTFFIRLEEEVYGHANPITIDFRYEKHKD